MAFRTFFSWVRKVIEEINVVLQKEVTVEIVKILYDESFQPFTQKHYLFEILNNKRKERFLHQVKPNYFEADN
jgi:hypothetical protein